ncbi:hypothetical protein SESBI_49813 [Sesbania bispinosa]|nr:hypothetical protein SESBI_49813 [Sesbania bispinosa]
MAFLPPGVARSSAQLTIVSTCHVMLLWRNRVTLTINNVLFSSLPPLLVIAGASTSAVGDDRLGNRTSINRRSASREFDMASVPTWNLIKLSQFDTPPRTIIDGGAGGGSEVQRNNIVKMCESDVCHENVVCELHPLTQPCATVVLIVFSSMQLKLRVPKPIKEAE